MSGIEGVERFLQNVRELDDELEEWVGKVHAALHVAAHSGVQRRIRPRRITGDTESRVRSVIGAPTLVDSSAGSPGAAHAEAKINAAAIRERGLTDSAVELNAPWAAKLEFTEGLGMFSRTHQFLFHSGLARDA